MSYIDHGVYTTRHTVVVAMARRLQGALGRMDVAFKPVFAVAPHPYRALEACEQWALATGVPCDGIIFVDDRRPGYRTERRLWKVKDIRTVDFAVFHTTQGTGLIAPFEGPNAQKDRWPWCTS